MGQSVIIGTEAPTRLVAGAAHDLRNPHHEDPDLHERMGALADEQRKLLETALKALEALKVGNVGLGGATGTVLEDSLVRLRELIDKSLPEIRLATGMTTPPAAKQGS